jgi:hypothetical protein
MSGALRTPQEMADGNHIRIPRALSPAMQKLLAVPTAEPERALPAGKQWVAHCGKQQQRRNLRRACAAVYRLKDEWSLRALARLRESIKDDPDPLAAEYNLATAALEASRACETTWAEAMDRLLDKFEERAG